MTHIKAGFNASPTPIARPTVQGPSHEQDTAPAAARKPVGGGDADQFLPPSNAGIMGALKSPRQRGRDPVIDFAPGAERTQKSIIAEEYSRFPTLQNAIEVEQTVFAVGNSRAMSVGRIQNAGSAIRSIKGAAEGSEMLNSSGPLGTHMKQIAFLHVLGKQAQENIAREPNSPTRQNNEVVVQFAERRLAQLMKDTGATSVTSEASAQGGYNIKIT